MRVLKSVWIGNFGNNILGIIKTEDVVTEKIVYYIGIGKGKCEQEDIILIIAGGQKYTEEQFRELFKEL